MDNGGKVIVGLGALGLAGAVVFAATRKAEAAPPEEEEEIVEEIIDAEYRKGSVWWAALTNWQKVNLSYINSWPADTDIRFAWEIRNIGDVGAYFQVYIFSPGSWMYLDPGDEVQVFEEVHTPVVPVLPGYQYNRVTILGRKLDGTRIGAVWASEEFEVIYT